MVMLLQINEFVKRARAAKIHAYIISHLKKEMPAMMGKAKTQKRLMDNLEEEFAKVTILGFLPLLSFKLYLPSCIYILQNRFRGSFIYQQATFQMWINFERS